MSHYTTQIRFLCENLAGLTESTGFNQVNNILDKATPLLFDFDFPIFDQNYKMPLCKKILRHYYTREIGSETVGLFRLRLETKMNEIMPYYNQLYQSELLKFEPFDDVNLTRTHQGTGSQGTTESTTRTSTGSSDTTKKETFGRDLTDDLTRSNTDALTRSENVSNTAIGSNTADSSTTDKREGHVGHVTNGTTSYRDEKNHLDKYSDTPQGALTGVQNGTYLTNARQIEESLTHSAADSGTGQDDSTESGESKVTGTGSYSDTATGETTGEENRTGSGKENRLVVENSTRTNTDESSTSGSENGSLDRDIKSTDEWIETVMGKQGNTNYSELLLKFRETFLNIDMMVINELEPLFMGLW